MADVQAERAKAEDTLSRLRPRQVMTAEDVRQMVSEVEDKVKMLSEADPEAKATLFSALGIRLTYHDQQKSDRCGIPTRVMAFERLGGGT
jgi:hypothetical protein